MPMDDITFILEFFVLAFSWRAYYSEKKNEKKAGCQKSICDKEDVTDACQKEEGEWGRFARIIRCSPSKAAVAVAAPERDVCRHAETVRGPADVATRFLAGSELVDKHSARFVPIVTTHVICRKWCWSRFSGIIFDVCTYVWLWGSAVVVALGREPFPLGLW
ncbi:unnamed protein product [Ectocarpus sp. 12 AP-2014]